MLASGSFGATKLFRLEDKFIKEAKKFGLNLLNVHRATPVSEESRKRNSESNKISKSTGNYLVWTNGPTFLMMDHDKHLF